jgi:hypothetical protein
MKIVGIALGVIIALALNRWAPSVLPSLNAAVGLSAAVGAIAVALSSSWAIALGRLSTFEKLDDLSSDQKKVVLDRAGKMRDGIIFALGINTVTIVASILFIILLPQFKLYADAYFGIWLMGCLGLWAGGFIQSLRCIRNIELSRLSIVETQALEKQRLAYIKKMREDENQTPVNRSDPHLNNYVKDCHGLT